MGATNGTNQEGKSVTADQRDAIVCAIAIIRVAMREIDGYPYASETTFQEDCASTIADLNDLLDGETEDSQ